jgi:hypothetical protein
MPGRWSRLIPGWCAASRTNLLRFRRLLCAIGAALTLGFHLKDNLDFPMPRSARFGGAGTSRFHILRDYLYSARR